MLLIENVRLFGDMLDFWIFFIKQNI